MDENENYRPVRIPILGRYLEISDDAKRRPFTISISIGGLVVLVLTVALFAATYLMSLNGIYGLPTLAVGVSAFALPLWWGTRWSVRDTERLINRPPRPRP